MSQVKDVDDIDILSSKSAVGVLDSEAINLEESQTLEKQHNRGFYEFTYSFGKRIVDIVVSAILLILLSPLFFVVAIAIKLDSEGPAIFKQQRIGKDGKLFNFYKFRTMVKDADAKLFELLEKDEKAREEYRINKKLKDDPRVIKIGYFLRKTSIDELPQLINVLKGEMSLVGPRPYLPREVEDMGDYYNTIIESKPGITGLWQVSGRSNTTFEKRLEYDTEYIKNQSITYDLKLLFKTIAVVVKKDGAQ